MPDIILPRRSSGGGRRSRPAKPIDASNVPQAGLARDPGLTVPKGAFGGGIGEGLDSLSGSLSNVSRDVQKIALTNKKKEDAAKNTKNTQKPEQGNKPEKDSGPEKAKEPEVIEAANRQTKTYDASESIVRQDQFQETNQGLLRAVVTDGDMASLSQLNQLKASIDSETRTALSALDEDDAAALSPEARASLQASYGETAVIFKKTAEAMHLSAQAQRATDQLAVSGDQAADQTREHMAALAAHENPLPILGLQFSLLDEKMNAFSGAFKDNREEGFRADGKVKIVEQVTTALAEQGRQTDALALLDSVLVSDTIGADARSRLKENTKILGADAEQDQRKEEATAARTAARDRDKAALSFSSGFRTRMEGGTAKRSEIGTAQNAGILTKELADRLRGEWTARENRNQANETSIARVTSALDAGVRLDPNALEDRDHVALHYESTLKPDLEALPPAEKAAEIRSYVEATRAAPAAAVESMLTLIATGEDNQRVESAKELNKILLIDPSAQDQISPQLAGYLRTVARFAEIPNMKPVDIIAAGEAGLRSGQTNSGNEKINPVLRQLAKDFGSPAAEEDATQPSQSRTQSQTPTDSDLSVNSQTKTVGGGTGTTEPDPELKKTAETNQEAESDDDLFFDGISDNEENTGKQEGASQPTVPKDNDELTPPVDLKVIEWNKKDRLGVFDGSTLIGFASNAAEGSNIADALKDRDPTQLANRSKTDDEKTPFGRVLSRITDAASNDFDGDIGISTETENALRSAGLLPKEGDNSLIGAFNSVLIKGGSVAADLALKALLAIESGVIAGIGQAARELGETETNSRRLERDLAVLAIVAGRHGRPLKSRRSKDKIARLETTRSPTPNQIKSLGDFSEGQRIQRLKPRNNFGGPGAFAKQKPEDAFASTRFPPKSPQENAFRGLAGVDLVIQDVLGKGIGDVANAMRRSDLPGGQAAITFQWGKSGAGIDFKGGSGLSHIIAKHGIESVEDVIETIAKGKIVPNPRPNRVDVLQGKTSVTLALKKFGNRETWVLTGFTKGKATGFFNLRELTGPIFFVGKR